MRRKQARSRILATGLVAGLALGSAGLGVVGCGGSEEGPAERMGKAIDETAQDAAEGAKDAAAKAQDSAAAAAQRLREGAAGAMDEAKEAMPDVAAPGDEEEWDEESYE